MKRLRGRAAFSLLEVMLALAILTGSITVLGIVIRSGAQNARIARDMTQAELLAEGLLAEITSGMVLPEAVHQVPFESDYERNLDNSGWLYSIAVTPLDDDGLLEIELTVEQDPDLVVSGVHFTLVRWMRDPEADAALAPLSSSSGSQSSL